MPSRLAIPPGAQHEDPVAYYRERAAYSRTRADQARDPQSRRGLEEAASHWELLARLRLILAPPV